MDSKTKPSLKLYILRAFVMAVAIFFMVIPVVQATDPDNVQCDRYKMDENWRVSVRGDGPNTVKLSEYSFKICNRNDKLTLEYTIPEEAGGISSPVVNFYSVHSTVDFFLDDELLYTYGWDIFKEDKLLGYGDHYISLPDDYVGKTIRVELTVTENSAFDGIQALWLEDSHTFIQKELAERRVNLMVYCFLALFGIILMVLSIIMMKQNSIFMQTYYIAMFSFLIAFWTFCNSDLITYITTNLKFKVYIEYMTMYTLPIPLLLYFREKVYDKTAPFFWRIIFWGLVGVSSSFVVTAYFSQWINIAHFPSFLPYMHILLLCCMAFVIGINVGDMRRKRKRGERQINSVMLGGGIAFGLVIFELAKYNLRKYLTGFEGNEYTSTLSFAVLTLVIALLIDYGQSISRNLYEDAQQKLLEKMAYMDELTGLANRRKCEDTLDELRNLGTPYSIISFDMNFLKQINDTKGHEMGDALLKKFASVINEIFGPEGTVGRMGGDEFMVVLPRKDKKEVDILMTRLLSAIHETNLSDHDMFFLSTAYGIAESREVNLKDDSHAAYKLADKRMYENKQETNHGRT